jgi:hypothetical protein
MARASFINAQCIILEGKHISSCNGKSLQPSAAPFRAVCLSISFLGRRTNTVTEQLESDFNSPLRRRGPHMLCRVENRAERRAHGSLQCKMTTSRGFARHMTQSPPSTSLGILSARPFGFGIVPYNASNIHVRCHHNENNTSPLKHPSHER